MKIAAALGDFHALHPVSAKTKDGVGELRSDLVYLLPEGPLYFPRDASTDQTFEERIAEVVREKALHLTREEVPHALTVVVEEIDDRSVRAFVLVETESQKGILVGKRGSMIREIGTRARPEVEASARPPGVPRAGRQGAPPVAPRPETARASRPVARVLDARGSRAEGTGGPNATPATTNSVSGNATRAGEMRRSRAGSREAGVGRGVAVASVRPTMTSGSQRGACHGSVSSSRTPRRDRRTPSHSARVLDLGAMWTITRSERDARPVVSLAPVLQRKRVDVRSSLRATRRPNNTARELRRRSTGSAASQIANVTRGSRSIALNFAR